MSKAVNEKRTCGSFVTPLGRVFRNGEIKNQRRARREGTIHTYC
jgi:hypothetical protein